MQFVSCVTFFPPPARTHTNMKTNDALCKIMATRLKGNNLFRNNKVSVVSKWHGVAYRRSGQLPCGSWRFPGGSRRRTDTSNPPGRESPPPADVTRWSSPLGSSALQTRRQLIAQISFHYISGMINGGDEDLQGADGEWNLNLIRLSAGSRSATCREDETERIDFSLY